jgi:predicted lysophospholipase L1 biosynthesis ABC-type transport system permease subunit
MFGLILLIALLLLAGFFLAMFGQPAGWLVLAAGAIVLIVVLARRGVDWGRWASRRSRPHGTEDARRGPNEDPMK